MEWVLQAWGIDGHNSHTNVCSARARLGYALWWGCDRPVPDHANARVHPAALGPPRDRALLQPARPAHHRGQDARREAGRDGHAAVQHRQHGRLLAAALAGQRSGRAAGHRAILLDEGLYDREFVARWVNWDEYLARARPGRPRTLRGFLEALRAQPTLRYTPEFAAAESGVRRRARSGAGARDRPRRVGLRHARLAQRRLRQPGRLAGGARLQFLHVLTGSVGTPGGTLRNAWDKWVPRPPGQEPPPQRELERAALPARVARSRHYEMSFLLPHFLKEGRGQARHLLHARLQPGLDQPRRADLGGGAAATRPRSACTSR